MASGPENRFIAGVHRTLAVGVYAMKNHNEYNGGIADCWYSGRPIKNVMSRDLWIEWKFISMPKREDTMIDMLYQSPKGKPIMTKLQQEWIADRCTEGRNVWVGVGSEDGGWLMRHDEWLTPFSAKTFKSRLVPKRDLAMQISSFCLGV